MDRLHNKCAISLLFEPEARPDLAAFREYAQSHDGFQISCEPGARFEGKQNALDHGRNRQERKTYNWIELLAGGLTFDLVGLRPGPTPAVPDRRSSWDLPEDWLIEQVEALEIHPGPHLAGGERMVPVVRAMAGLAAKLCDIPGLSAFVWHPAGSYVSPSYFASVVDNWLTGGIFPARGMVTLDSVVDGALQSEGVAFFTGQELRVEPELTVDRLAAEKIGVRLIDYLFQNGRLDESQEVIGPEGRKLRIDPSENGRIVRIWSAG